MTFSNEHYDPNKTLFFTLDAIHEWEFTPAVIDGEPVSSVTQLNFNYNRDSSGASVLPVSLMEYIDKRSVITQPEDQRRIILEWGCTDTTLLEEVAEWGVQWRYSRKPQ